MSFLDELDQHRSAIDPEYAKQNVVYKMISELRTERRKQGLTQSEVAEKAGLRQSHVSRIENFEFEKLALDTILRYANAIGVEFRLVKPKLKKAS